MAALDVEPASGRVVPGGGLLTIACRASGSQPINLVWLLNDKRLVRDASSLCFLVQRRRGQGPGASGRARAGPEQCPLAARGSAVLSDSGNYTCVVSNSANPGGARASAPVTVVELPAVLPGAPADVTIQSSPCPRSTLFSCPLAAGSPP